MYSLPTVGPNLAKHHDVLATSSHFHPARRPEATVDGLWTSNMKHGSCWDSEAVESPWLAVDMGTHEPVYVHKVIVVNRGDQNGEWV